MSYEPYKYSRELALKLFGYHLKAKSGICNRYIIIEMCADWCAMSEELNDDVLKWAENNIGEKWNFNKDQKELIYEILEVMTN